MKKITLFFAIVLFVSNLQAQFHTLNIPKTSPKVEETQVLGVTSITISYHSPATRGRDVWKDVVPYDGKPLPWRAGANMNTTISFTTDVMIEGKSLKAGVYGFHIIPHKDNTHTLLFAHNSQQWGSYYLDTEKDITLKVDVKDTVCTFSEQMDYEFINRSESSVKIALQWGEKSIPFEVSVDLNKTVIASFRKELRGSNTYRWEAWNDAALWCYNHNTNLEEALTWANRSMTGGYGGFAANKNLINLSTKMKILEALGKNEEMTTTFAETENINDYSANQAYDFSYTLITMKKDTEAISFLEKAIKKHPEVWYLKLNLGAAQYFMGKTKQTFKTFESMKTPDSFKKRLQGIMEDMKAGKYKYPNRKS